MTYFLEEKQKVKVKQQGIKVNGKFYYSPILNNYLDKYDLVYDSMIYIVKK